MSFIVQKAAVSGTVAVFSQPTLVRNLIVLAVSWAEDQSPGNNLVFQDGTHTAPHVNTTDDGSNVYFQVHNPSNNGIIMACVEANSAKTITLHPQIFNGSTFTPHTPTGLRFRAYEVSNMPGPLSGILPQGGTNVESNSCCGIGQIALGSPKAPSTTPADTITAGSWSDSIGAQAFFIFLLIPDGGAGFDNFSGNVTAVASPFTLDDPFGPSGVAVLSGSADSNQTATFSWTNTGDWTILSAAWEAFGNPANFCGGMASQVVGNPLI